MHYVVDLPKTATPLTILIMLYSQEWHTRACARLTARKKENSILVLLYTQDSLLLTGHLQASLKALRHC